MLIGAQLYTLREFTQTEAGFAGAVKKVAAIGYETVQISGAGPLGAKFFAETCKKYGVGAVITHTPPERIKNETDTVITEHRLLGADYIGIGMMPGEYHGGAEGTNAFIKDYLPAAKRIREAGMKLMYHNHDFEFEKFGNRNRFEYLIEGFPAEDLGFTLDTFWVQAAGGDPADWIKKLSGRVDVLHIKDMCFANGERRMCCVSCGNLNWPAIKEACTGSGVLHAMVEQDECYGNDPFECLKISFANANRIFNQK
ncbi:MAG: sugar phosphate isomerase/epimerase [Defluviitaleaceae bacterium]|nr:sugar phosphate isomerase/epimerase [Defluviitaleaceae bacterium]